MKEGHQAHGRPDNNPDKKVDKNSKSQDTGNGHQAYSSRTNLNESDNSNKKCKSDDSEVEENKSMQWKIRTIKGTGDLSSNNKAIQLINQCWPIDQTTQSK